MFASPTLRRSDEKEAHRKKPRPRETNLGAAPEASRIHQSLPLEAKDIKIPRLHLNFRIT